LGKLIKSKALLRYLWTEATIQAVVKDGAETFLPAQAHGNLMFMGDRNGTNVVQDVGYPIMDDILTSFMFPIFLWSLRLRSKKSLYDSML
jgi:hypothetical protein